MKIPFLNCPKFFFFQSLYLGPINRYATAAQKKIFQKPFLDGKKVGCFALSEPGVLIELFERILHS